MSLFSALIASASGMAAQSNKLATISQNIANVDTTGYKQVSTEFESLVNEFDTTGYVAGGVATSIFNNITQQGTLVAASATTDLAIGGNGFFVVQDANGARYLTRAGAFDPNSSGVLENAAGFTLMGYKVDTSSSGAGASASGQLEPVNLSTFDMKATPSTSGVLTANLDSRAARATGNLPSANVAPASYTSKSSMVTYDNLGTPVTLDVYFSKTASNTWEVTVYNAADATGAGGFPYAHPALATSTLNFDGTNGKLTSPTSLSLSVPNGRAMTLDLSHMTQLASPYAVSNATTNGHAPSTLQSVSVGSDGTLSGVYSDGETVPLYKIPLATVPSPNRLEPISGGVYRAGLASGDIVVGTAGSEGLGTIQGSALETSTVDLASELSDMVVAQRGYESNTKAFQASSELISDLVKMLT